MSPTVPKQHPAVVLRSHYLHLRGLLAITVIALVAMAVAVVILASAVVGRPLLADGVGQVRADLRRRGTPPCRAPAGGQQPTCSPSAVSTCPAT